MCAAERQLTIAEVIQLPGELEGRGRSVETHGTWLRHARHLSAAATFLVHVTNPAEAAGLFAMISDDWLDSAGRDELLEEIKEYVKAAYEGPLRTSEHRLDTARRRIARGETPEQYRGDLDSAIESAHDYRGAAESRQANHEVAYADLILAESYALHADQGEAVDRALRAHAKARATLDGAVEELEQASANEQMVAYNRAMKRFEHVRPSCELVMLSAATFLSALDQRPALVVLGEGSGSLTRPNKAMSAWRDGRDAVRRWSAEKAQKPPKEPKRRGPIV